MKKLDFEQMEIISAGLTQNQTCLIGGAVFTAAAISMNWAFACGVAVGALYYGCF